MIIETGPDIVNFDACGYLDFFLLYPQEIKDFIKAGGAIAWGIVPTMDFTGEESTEGLYLKLEEGIHRFHEWGMDSASVSGGSILTPSCGMGTMDQASADRTLRLLSMLSQKCGAPDQSSR
jgi:hypothetical protein